MNKLMEAMHLNFIRYREEDWDEYECHQTKQQCIRECLCFDRGEGTVFSLQSRRFRLQINPTILRVQLIAIKHFHPSSGDTRAQTICYEWSNYFIWR
jgi:hypothetical protein